MKPWDEVYKSWKSRNPNLSTEERGMMVRGCLGKDAFPNVIQAWSMANRLPLRVGRAVTVYKCEVCDRLHVGNRKATKSELIRLGQGSLNEKPAPERRGPHGVVSVGLMKQL